MKRVTQKDLEILVDRINVVTGSPREYSTKDESGKYFHSNIGHYHLSYAYGGVKLERLCNESGGVSTVSHDGYGTKRQLYSFMIAFLDGFQESK